MSPTDRHPDDVEPDAPPDDTPPTAPLAALTSAAGEPGPTVLDRMGGPMGVLHSAIPVVVFVAANAFLSLPLTIAVSVTAGLVLFGFRLARGERFTVAIGSVLGVIVATGLVALTGTARNFFAIGIWLALAGMGTPLTVLAALVILWASRRSTRRLITPGP
ncbi:DUF3159 domain-containing protein [Pseudonocardia sp. CA-142604]|uniref:DUF3159 domain-containing protein n=1 Tax=Pseudonocardia sp. CA-142604 TaxID=3240024 RepID=UPI003D930970